MAYIRDDLPGNPAEYAMWYDRVMEDFELQEWARREFVKKEKQNSDSIG